MRRRLAILACGLGGLACADAAGETKTAAEGGAAEQVAGATLPPGEGQAILKAACISCHDLGGLQAYAGYYDAEDWREMIDTMVDHGAALDERQVATLADYLATHFGPASR